MTNFEIIGIVVLIFLAITITILRLVKNINDGNEENNDQIKNYIFTCIDDIMTTIKVVNGRTEDDTREYIIDGVIERLEIIKDQTGIKIDIPRNILKGLISSIIDANFKEAIDHYTDECMNTYVNNDEDMPEESNNENCDSEEIEGECTSPDGLFDTLKDEEGNEVELPEGNLNDEPDEIAEEQVEDTVEESADEVVEETPVEKETADPKVDCVCIECMTKPEIKAWAADHGIFVSSKMLKSDMIEKVKAEYEAHLSEE